MKRGATPPIRALLVTGTLVSTFLGANHAEAWTFPEHTRITRRALELLAKHRDAAEHLPNVMPAVINGLRLSAHAGKRSVDYGVLPSLAGDHSCTPLNLQYVVAGRHDREKWVLDVLDVADKTEEKLESAGADASSREAVRRWMHVEFQLNDWRYIERAEVDSSHFQIEREGPGNGDAGLAEYLRLSFSPLRRANATAAYANYHVAAVRLAAAAPKQAAAQRQDYLARAFMAEAFALHFLEDSFSSGHFVGHWGDEATRHGTHDYYSGAAIDAKTWSDPDTSYVAHGDAFLSDAECDRIARAAVESLSQVVLAAVGEADHGMLAEFSRGLVTENYDSCRETLVPIGLGPLAESSSLKAVVDDEPVPSLRHPEVPRMRTENGLFFGANALSQAGHVFKNEQFDGRVGVGIRVGLGVAGLVNDPLNAQAFIEPGLVGEHLYGEDSQSLIGYALRVRAPGYIFLVDGLIAVVLAETLRSDCPECVEFAAAAAGGGLFRLWREVHITERLSGQISALRDVTAIWYRNEPDAGDYRLELLFPVLTARYYFPMSSGSSWSQSTDMYFDVGPSVTWSSDHPGYGGVFASFSIAARIFP